MANQQSVTALILAGGRARRMGGNDKGLITLAGETMVQRIARQLENQVDHIVINANRHLDQYASYGYPVVTDHLNDFQGPLAGMLAGLTSVTTDWLLTAPCDGPFVAPDYCQEMLAAAETPTVKIAVASDGKRLQPVYALLHRTLKDSLEKFLENGDRKIDRWYQQHAFAEVVFGSQNSMFVNTNTPEELAEVENLIAV